VLEIKRSPGEPLTRAARAPTLSAAMRLAAFAIVFCVTGCGGADAPSELGPFPGWPETVEVRAVGESFRTSAARLEVDPDGRIWLLRREWPDAGPALGTSVLERYDGGGRLEKRIVFPEDTLVRDFVVHPSGELSAFLLQADGDAGQFRLDTARLSPDGEELFRREFHDVAGPRENLYYDETGAHPFPTDRPLRLGQFSHVVALADGEGVYLLAWTWGAKLYRLGPDHAQAWNVQVMPANVGMAFFFTHELLATDDDGGIHVAYQIFADDVAIYNEHFGRAPLAPIDSYDVLLSRFDGNGGFSGAQIFGGPGGDVPTGMTARGGRTLVTGAVRRTKHDLPNRTREWDLFVWREGDYRTFDLARDDFAWDLAQAPDGTVYLAGQTDYVQVDTNSQVEDGKGFFLALSPDLERQADVTLPGPRDVVVQAMRLAPDGRLVFAGTRNGPLTHTDPAMQFNEGVLGAVSW